MSRLSTGKKLFFLGIIIVVTLLGLRYSAGAIGQLSPISATLRDVLAPVERVVMVASREISNALSYPVQLVHAQRHNQELEDMVAELEGKLLKYREVQAENTRLKKLLDFNTEVAAELDLVPGTVISRDPDNWFGNLIINIGSQNGIEPDMAVITSAGLVGRVVRTSAHTAEVLLITDPRSGVGAIVQDSRAPGIAEGVAGKQGGLRMIHIPMDLTPQKGDVVVTSGLGSVFPKGIPVGVVREVRKEKSGLFMMADLETYVDFNRLEEVSVIKSFHPGGGS